MAGGKSAQVDAEPEVKYAPKLPEVDLYMPLPSELG